MFCGLAAVFAVAWRVKSCLVKKVIETAYPELVSLECISYFNTSIKTRKILIDKQIIHLMLSRAVFKDKYGRTNRE